VSATNKKLCPGNSRAEGPGAAGVRFAGARDQFYRSFKALANLAKKSDGGKITVQVDGLAGAGCDQNWLRNAVEEPLDEANIEGLESE